MRLRRPAGQGEREDYARSHERRGDCRPEGSFSTLWQAWGLSSHPFSKLGGPGPLSSGPADGRKQAEFTSAVSAAGVVQAPPTVQRVLRKRAVELLGSRKRSAPACRCRPMFPRCGNIGEIGRDFQIVRGERLTDALGTFRRQRPVVSTLREKPGCRNRPFFQRAKKRGGLSSPPLSTLWGPGPLSSGPADGRKQPEFTSGVSAAGAVQALRSVQRVWSRRATAKLGRRNTS